MEPEQQEHRSENCQKRLIQFHASLLAVRLTFLILGIALYALLV